uniref:hypothetical protein n=1 Tax=uncultured Draconibacterium sp. TaxID=1573823 RepID=UPI00321683E9
MGKSTISYFLICQAKNCLDIAIQSKEKKDIESEVQNCINISLLLAIILEGVINDIAEVNLDSWTWKELEKASMPLKWRIISGLKIAFDPSQEPLQTINKLYKIRNKIVHPKLEDIEDDVLAISEAGEIKQLIKDSDVLPEGDLKIYIGFGDRIKNFNVDNSLKDFKMVLKAITEIKNIFQVKESLDWAETIYSEIKVKKTDNFKL